MSTSKPRLRVAQACTICKGKKVKVSKEAIHLTCFRGAYTPLHSVTELSPNAALASSTIGRALMISRDGMQGKTSLIVEP
jgi:hypothetical protein